MVESERFLVTDSVLGLECVLQPAGYLLAPRNNSQLCEFMYNVGDIQSVKKERAH